MHAKINDAIHPLISEHGKLNLDAISLILSMLEGRIRNDSFLSSTSEGINSANRLSEAGFWLDRIIVRECDNEKEHGFKSANVYYQQQLIVGEKFEPEIEEIESYYITYSPFLRPIADNHSIVGSIFYEDILIQKFVVHFEDRFKFTDVVQVSDDKPIVKVVYGSIIYSPDGKKVNLLWNSKPSKNHHIVLDYEYACQ